MSKPLDANQIARERGIDELRRVIDETPSEAPPIEGWKEDTRTVNDGQPKEPGGNARTAREGQSTRKPPRFILTPFDAIKPDDGSSYLVKGLLSGTGLAVVWGAPKCGKSFWTFDLLMHVAIGWEYRGRRVQQSAVVYCALEGAQGFRNRVEAFRVAKLAESHAAPPFYLMSTSLSLVADAAQLVADIKAQLGDTKPAVVCIDTLNRSLTGSESSDEDMSAYIRAADAIRDAFGCLVVIVHHCGHEGNRPRGHSSLMGALDVQIAVRRDAADHIVAELELSKDGETGAQFVSRLKVVGIGADQEGDPITSCIIEAIDAPAVAANAKKGRVSDVEMIKRAIEDAYARLSDGVEPSPGFNGAPVRKIPVEKLRDEIKSRGFLETDDGDKLTSTARSNFRRAKTDLIAAKRFIEADKQFWRLLKSQPEGQEGRLSF